MVFKDRLFILLNKIRLAWRWGVFALLCVGIVIEVGIFYHVRMPLHPAAPQVQKVAGKVSAPVATDLPNKPDQEVFGAAESALMAQAEELQAEQKLAEAVVVYEKLAQMSPNLAEIHFRLGALYFHLGLKDKSEAAYLKAIGLDFKNPEIYFHLGYIKESEAKFQEALEWYLKAEEKGVNSAEIYFNIGNVFAQLGNKDRAIEYYKKAVVVSPKHMDAFINLSTTSFRNGQYADAKLYLDKARELGYTPPQEYLDAIAAKLSGK
ncbi:MAG: tetratricopeptide repeat protein [Candidatus Omnitrophica bacterium]|nr:tetratricopeptide repeat protein [Candidatus Omnitrophota bacterium]